ESTLEAVSAAVIFSLMHKLCQMIPFPLHICIEERHITLTSAPEHISLAAYRDGCIQSTFDLAPGISQKIEIRIRSRTVHKTRMAEQIGCAPKQLNATILMLLPGIIDQRLQPFFRFGNGISLIHQIYIVKAIIRHAKLGNQLKSGIHLG